MNIIEKLRYTLRWLPEYLLLKRHAEDSDTHDASSSETTVRRTHTYPHCLIRQNTQAYNVCVCVSVCVGGGGRESGKSRIQRHIQLLQI